MVQVYPLSDHPRVLPAAEVVAGFEVGMLLRCARTGSGRHDPSTAPADPVEFSRAAAADRLTDLLTGLGFAARTDDYAAGGRHRYTVYRVTCADLSAPGLTAAWCAGYRRLCAPEAYLPQRRRQHRMELAEAAWRAAVLGGGLRRRGGPLAVRVADPELGLILVRAARVLAAPVRLHTAGGRHLVEVASGHAELALRRLAG